MENMERRGVGRGELETEVVKSLAKELVKAGIKLGNHLMISNGHPGVVMYGENGTYLLTVEKVSSAVIHQAENDGYERGTSTVRE